MARNSMMSAATLVLLLASARVDAGHMHLEWMDCDPVYKIWEVAWGGTWNVLGGKHLDRGTTNNGPWQRIKYYVGDSGCYFPARNLHWYRIAKPAFPFGSQSLASVWVPQTRCTRGWVQ